MRNKLRQVLLALICVTAVLMLMPNTSALAADNCHIGTTDVTDYFVYYGASGTWKDLNTPEHYVTETGAVAYCLRLCENARE